MITERCIYVPLDKKDYEKTLENIRKPYLYKHVFNLLPFHHLVQAPPPPAVVTAATPPTPTTTPATPATTPAATPVAVVVVVVMSCQIALQKKKGVFSVFIFHSFGYFYFIFIFLASHEISIVLTRLVSSWKSFFILRLSPQ